MLAEFLLQSSGKRIGFVLVSIIMLLNAGVLRAQHSGRFVNDPAMPEDPKMIYQGSEATQRTMTFSALAVTQSALTTDSLALVDLYNATGGAQWTTKTNWLTGRISTWFGVTVAASRVTSVVLNGNKLTGNIPASIGNMTALTRLNLSVNSLRGGIPQEIGNLTALTQLMLFDNPLGGQIPSSIGNLTALQNLYVYRDSLTGDIPSSFSSLVNLRILAYHQNDLTGNLNWLGTQTLMTQLFSYTTKISGTIPSSIGNCISLQRIYLYTNPNLTGTIPTTIGNLTALQQLYLHDLPGLTGELPASMGNLVNLTHFWVHFNYGITGNFPTWIGRLTKLISLSIGDTGMGGPIPTEIGSLVSLQELYLQRGGFTGELPSTLANATGLRVLDIKFLHLTILPEWLKNLTLLNTLIANDNNISSIPDFTTHVNRANLVYNVENNQLDFQDLEKHFTSPGVTPYKTFTYSPQQTIGSPQTISWNSNGGDTLRVNAMGQFNLYQWQKKSLSGGWSDLPGETRSFYTKSYVLPSDSGHYRLEISNQKVNALNLYSAEFIIQISDSVAGNHTNKIPAALRVTRDGRQLQESFLQQSRLSQLDEGDTLDVFQGCIDGDYYLAVQLKYDLGDRNTTIPWNADLAVTLINGSDSLWTKALNASMVDQTFITTVFEDSLISCTEDYQIIVTRKSVTSGVPGDNVYLRFLLYRNPDAEFNPTTPISLNCNYANHTTTLGWSSSAVGVMEYDVEWVFIEEHENFPGTTGPEAFAFKEPVRVTTDSLHYTHMVYYPDGKLWYRIRAVGVNPRYPDHRIPGQWFYTPCGVIDISNHEPQKNWQEQTVFAEEGKYKKVMNYFDGSLRQRQTQTNLNTEAVTLVAETYYDFEGRQSMSALAVPAGDQSLTFKASFNEFSAVDPDVSSRTSPARQKFHYDNQGQTNSVASTGSGAGNYYSPQNNRSMIHRNYVPDAKGFVFSQTEYVNEGTSRVAKQSGVGEEFRMDGNHTTRYFYGNVAPAEIIRLFGSNVGKASHYKKNLVVDPNGQVSVSYMDQEDRVIATALAGEKPDNVAPLPSYTELPEDLVTVDLTDKTIKRDGVSTISHKILNTSPNTDYTFNYDLFALASTVERIGCIGCSFELTIEISGPDGSLVELPSIPGNQSGNLYSYYRPNITASNCTSPDHSEVEFTLSFADIGDYTITKTLKAKELSFTDMETIVRQDSSFSTKVNEIQSTYQVDSTECDVCMTAACTNADSLINQSIEEIAELDCDNIYQEIVQYFTDQYPDSAGYVPPDSLIATHTLYCKYTLCAKNKSSDAFEKQMGRLSGWDAATAAGYTDYVQLVNNHDPFFSNALSGYGYNENMLDRLGNIALSSSLTGTLTDVTNPGNTNFYFDANGNPDPVNGKHILYEDLMTRRSQMTPEQYTLELDRQHWTLFRSFYTEEKRKVKLLTEYKDCGPARQDLETQGSWNSIDTPSEAIDFAHENGLVDTLGAEDVAMSYYSIQSNCDADIIDTDSTSIQNHLIAYFESNPSNFFRLILTEDLDSHPDILAIKGILSGYGCGLDSIALDNPLVCLQDTVIAGTQAQVLVNGSSPVATKAVDGGSTKRAEPKLETPEMAQARTQALKDEVIKSLSSTQTTASRVQSSSVTQFAAPLPSQLEYNALIDLYNSTRGNSWRNRTNWNPVAGPPQSVETWFGVVVDPTTGAVLELNLPGNGLSGPLPASIGNLSSLKVLDLGTLVQANGATSFNSLTGSLPGTLSNLSALEKLDLDRTQNLVGSLPDLAGLTSLKVVDMRGNRFTGGVPATYFTSIPNLEVLDLSTNYSMAGPFPASFTGATKMRYLDLSNISFSGSIPSSISSMADLEYLIINANPKDQLSGSLPSSFSSMRDLKVVELRNHYLSGAIPHLLLMQGLQRLDLSANAFTGNFPTLGGLAFQHINLSNNMLVGTLPNSIGQYASLTNLSLNNNGFSGSIPTTIGQLASLTMLELSENDFYGNVPSTIGDLNNLQWMGLAGNRLFGDLPPTLVDDASNLYGLTLNENSFTFRNILPLMNYPWGEGCGGDDSGPCFTYAPQDSVEFSVHYTAHFGQPFYLEAQTDKNTTPLSRFQWFRYVDGVNDQPLIPEPSTSGYLYTFNSLQPSDQGIYYFKIWNDDISDLELTSRFKRINIPFSDCTLSSDRVVLMNLFNATNGPAWENKTYWMDNSAPLDFWYGVTTNAEGHVTELQLPDNNLSGNLIQELKNLCYLETINVSGNNLSGTVPPLTFSRSTLRTIDISRNDLSGDLSAAFEGQFDDSMFRSYDIDNNKFTFTDILDVVVNALSQAEPNITYAPQDTIDVVKNINVPPGQSLTLTTNIDRAPSLNCLFQWFKDGVALNEPSVDNHTLVIPGVTSQDAGTYYYVISQSDANELNLISHPQHVVITSDSSSVCLEYDPDNATLNKLTFEVDWNEVVEQCLANAAKEDSILIDYAVEKLIEEEATTFYYNFITNCMDNAVDSLKYSYQPKEYHYTLYYFDQAGSLVQTVPPNGVHPLTDAQVKAFMRGNKTEPAHTMLTRYRFSSVDQFIWHKTPDAGESQFWYDDKGQLRISQNAQQSKDNRYSYTKYDEQGRIIEVGEMTTVDSITVLLDQLELQKFPWPNASCQLTDITRTHYDFGMPLLQPSFVQQNLRTRVAWVEVVERDRPDTVATFYTYDIHGNVKSLLQYLPGLGHKRTDYVYDLFNGKIDYVMYDYGGVDEFTHRYRYDADNRLTEVYTSSDGYLWDRDARYFYYQHGPLARMELGDYRVQGLDYYYTLQGWIKGVNMPFAEDPARDGYSLSPVGRDVFAYTLGYYQDDFQSINSSTVIADNRDQIWSRYESQYQNNGLFNGNIGWMITDLKKVGQQKGSRAKGVQGMMYQYNQLNRIVQSNSLTHYIPGSGFAPRSGVTEAFDETYTYDPNGNILTLQRRDGEAQMMDDFHYSYFTGTNKLKFLNTIVRDTVYQGGAVIGNNKVYRNIRVEGSSYVPVGRNVELRATENIDVTDEFNVLDDANFHAYILTEDEGSYLYDAIGNLIWNQDEGVKIEWTPYGKVREVRSHGDSLVVQFRYDAAGNRIEKRVITSLAASRGETVTRYLRDAGGNAMAVYSDSAVLEQNIYGSARLGLYRGRRAEGQQKLGGRTFELNNHLGNVLSVVKDNVGMSIANDSAWASVVSVMDYYPFGLEMKGRTFSDTTYRYGFNAREQDKGEWGSVAYDYGFRIYDPRLGRFHSVDPLASEVPMLTPYQFAGNTPIQAIDLDGLEKKHYLLTLDDQGKTKLEFLFQEDFEESHWEWEPKLGGTSLGFSLWTEKTEKNPRLDYVVHGVVEYNAGVDGDIGPFETPTTWTFSSEQEMRTAESRGGVGHDPAWIWIGCDDQMVISVNIALWNSLEAEGDNGGTRGLWRSPMKLKPPGQRPNFRKGVVDKVWENAVKNSPNGKVIDPAGEEITWNRNKPRGKQWHMGHLPGKEYKKLYSRYIKGEITWKQLSDEYNNPANYRPELPATNQSHAFEEP